MVERFKIILLCVVGAVVYGIIHDEITAHVCVEYFTKFHRAIFWDAHSPAVLGLEWGVVATYGVGFFLGVPLGIFSTVGPLPKVSVWELVRPLALGLMVLGLVALCFGLLGYCLESRGVGVLWEDEVDFLEVNRRAVFAFDKFAHLASYGFGGILGVVMCVWVVRRRQKMRRELLARSDAARSQRQ